MVVAVTGASGDVGGYVVDELQAHGHEVVTVDLREPTGPQATYREADVTDLDALNAAFEGCDAIVHLAAIREAGILPPAPTFHVNAQGTMNALEAAVAVGAKRFVLASSEAVLGFAYRTRDFLPEYFPMDEDHPLQPQDSYGASKIAAEELCRSYARSGALTTVALRPCYCWGIGLGDEAREAVENPELHHRSMWLYIHLKDIARAYRLAVEVEGIEHETVYVVADDIRANVPTEELLERFYPGVPRKRPLAEFGALIDNSRAREVLGFSPTISWRDELDPATIPGHLPPA